MDSGLALRAPRNDETKKPAVICDDRLFTGTQESLRAYATQRLQNLRGTEARLNARLADDLGGDLADAGAGQADGAGGAGRAGEHKAAHERATVIDGDDDALAVVGDPQLGAERQRAMGAGHGAGIHALARRGAAAGLVAGIGGHAREG